MPPWKQYPGTTGAEVDHLKYFVDRLFGIPGNDPMAFRKQFFDIPDSSPDGLHGENVLRQMLADNQIIIPPDDGAKPPNPIHIVLVDVQTAHLKCYYKKFNAANDLFYLLVMPPIPTQYNADMQAWESAWYHAIVDGFGM